jgi:hypothetical protein
VADKQNSEEKSKTNQLSSLVCLGVRIIRVENHGRLFLLTGKCLGDYLDSGHRVKSKEGSMSIENRPRGRPRGTGKDDSLPLTEVADLLVANPLLKPTTAMKRVMQGGKDWGATDETLLRRWQDKWKHQGEVFLAAARERARPKPMAQPAVPAHSWATLRALPFPEDAHTRAMREYANGPAKAMQDYINSPASKALLDYASSPVAKAMLDYANSPTAKATRDYLDSPAMRAINSVQTSAIDRYVAAQQRLMDAIDPPLVREMRRMEELQRRLYPFSF